MRKLATFEIIEREIEKLKPQEQLKLVRRLTHRLRKTRVSVKKELDWKEFYGLGKGLWKKEDAQKYVNRLREERDDTFR
ncbi:MAG: hypothetical protein Q7J76_05670 [Candidatus Brocadiaceae bacterium]|jgi:hypothetical protein|uniref:hypothetical protein n=1 Tax=Candidatus Wunengus sp. YC61 TaxID=3367698 RepID=UPI00271A70DA|nr:hypothetical protein [Candidatus Brocadiaceae bacterium]